PLRGMPITQLKCFNTLVSNFQPLADLPLSELRFSPFLFHAEGENQGQELSVSQLGNSWHQVRSAENFWKELAVRQQSAKAFASETARLSVEEQAQAVLARLQVRRDGKRIQFTPTIQDGVIHEVTIA